jgi:hypothetical protein
LSFTLLYATSVHRWREDDRNTIGAGIEKYGKEEDEKRVLFTL